MTHVSLFGEANTMGFVLDEDDQMKLTYQRATMTALRSYEKSNYAN